MSELKDYREHISIRESLLQEENNKTEKALMKAQDYIENRYDAKERKEKIAEAYSDFRCFVKDTLLSEAIKSLYVPAINLDENHIENVALVDTVVKNFISENVSSDTIFLRNNSGSAFIEALHDLIDEHSSYIIESVDKEDPTTFKVNKNNIKDFLDDLNKEEDYSEIKDTIRNRVASAEEEFLANAMADKQSMDQIISQTSANIDAIKADENIQDATKDAIATEAAAASKEKIYQVRNRKGKSVFESMIEKLSTSIYSNPVVRESFTLESGKINMDMVAETARCMYGLLETLHTTKLIKVDEEYIQNALDQM